MSVAAVAVVESVFFTVAAPVEENINPEMQDLATQDIVAQDMGVMQDGQMDADAPTEL